MVKVEGLTEEEINLRKKTSKLFEIAEDTLVPNKEGVFFRGALSVYISPDLNILIGGFPGNPFPSYPISVDVKNNRIYVETPYCFNRAIELARAYEDAGEGEFTVKRNHAGETSKEYRESEMRISEKFPRGAIPNISLPLGRG